MAGNATPATTLLDRTATRYCLHAYDHDVRSTAGYGEEAVEALGVSPERVFKTLLVEVDGTLTVAVVPVGRQLDLKALAAAVGGRRAAMADPAKATRATGYVLGGISPLGQRTRLRLVLDETATALGTLYVSAGRRGLEVELAPEDLLSLTGGTTAPISR